MVSERIQSFQQVHSTEFQQPYGDVVEQLISAAFWASLGREEGNAPTISLALLPPENVTRPLMFSTPLPLDPSVLVRLAPAVERPGIHLGVWEYDGELRVWGTTRIVPTWCFVLEVIEPGLSRDTSSTPRRLPPTWMGNANIAPTPRSSAAATYMGQRR